MLRNAAAQQQTRLECCTHQLWLTLTSDEETQFSSSYKSATWAASCHGLLSGFTSLCHSANWCPLYSAWLQIL